MTTKLADNAVTENAKKVQADEAKATEKSRAEFAERTKGKPTPTQEENDIVALGGHILEHEHDGSNVEQPPHTKTFEPDKAAKPGYTTRDQKSDQTRTRTE